MHLDRDAALRGRGATASRRNERGQRCVSIVEIAVANMLAAVRGVSSSAASIRAISSWSAWAGRRSIRRNRAAASHSNRNHSSAALISPPSAC